MICRFFVKQGRKICVLSLSAVHDVLFSRGILLITSLFNIRHLECLPVAPILLPSSAHVACQDSTADVKKAVWTFCKNPAANLIAPASASKSQPLTGVSAYGAFIYLSFVSVYLCLSLSVCLSMSLSICLSVSVYLSLLSLSVCICVYIFLHLS